MADPADEIAGPSDWSIASGLAIMNAQLTGEPTAQPLTACTQNHDDARWLLIVLAREIGRQLRPENVGVLLASYAQPRSDFGRRAHALALDLILCGARSETARVLHLASSVIATDDGLAPARTVARYMLEVYAAHPLPPVPTGDTP